MMTMIVMLSLYMIIESHHCYVQRKSKNLAQSQCKLVGLQALQYYFLDQASIRTLNIKIGKKNTDQSIRTWLMVRY